MFSWSDELEIYKKYNGIHGYAIQRKGFLDATFVPKAIVDSPQFHAVVAKFAPTNHVLLAPVPQP
jgi:hypothetical protein